MTHAALVAVDATPTALVHAFHPILTAALGTVLLHERFAPWQWLGVALGFVGVVLGVPLSLGTGNLSLLGLSLFGLTAGTLILKRFCADVPPFESTAVQLIGGALVAILLMLLFETPHWRWTAHFAARAGLEHPRHVDLRHGDLQRDARPPRRRPGLVRLLRGAGRLRADGVRAAQRAACRPRRSQGSSPQPSASCWCGGGRRPGERRNFSDSAPLPHRFRLVTTEDNMTFGKGALLWLIGVPLPIILLLALFWHN